MEPEGKRLEQSSSLVVVERTKTTTTTSSSSSNCCCAGGGRCEMATTHHPRRGFLTASVRKREKQRFCIVNLLTSLLAVALYHSLSSGFYVSQHVGCQQEQQADSFDPKNKRRRKGEIIRHGHHHVEPSSGLSRPEESLQPPQDWNIENRNTRRIDVGVPVSGQDDKLLRFVSYFGSSIKEFRKKTTSNSVHFRLLITRYSNDDSSDQFQTKLAQNSTLDRKDVVFVHAPAEQKQFHRAYAINRLHQHTNADSNSILAIIDVDLMIGPHFFVNAINYVEAGSKVYFPIVFSMFRPSNIRLVESMLGEGSLPKFHEHTGLWRDFGFGIYVLSGTDANQLLMNETFQGWGGEDNDFKEKIENSPHIEIVREREYDLVHIWHSKNCNVGSFVEEVFLERW